MANTFLGRARSFLTKAFTSPPVPTIQPQQQIASIPGSLAQVPARIPMTLELGTAGLKHWYGRFYEEWIPELQGESGKRKLQEMATNDSTASMMLFAVEQLIKQTAWSVKPVDESDEELARADFLQSCVDDMYVPWAEFLSEVCSMLVHGFALHEPVFKVRRGMKPASGAGSRCDDGRLGWHKLAPRSQETIFRWLIEDGTGDLTGIVQWAPPLWQQVAIPIEKLIHFKTAGRRNNPEGISLLRGAYRSWQQLVAIEDIEGIGIERDLCGVPYAQIDDHVCAAAAQGNAEAKRLYDSIVAMVTRVKMDEQGGIVMPLGYDADGHELYKFGLIAAPGQRTINTTEVINRKKQQIAGALVADFLLLGHEKVGSFSLASSKTDIFALVVAGIMDTICGPMNRVAIPQLFEANGEDGPYPEIVHGDVETIDPAVLGPFVTVLTNAGVDLSDEATVAYLREVGGLPTTQEGAGRKAAPKAEKDAA